MAHLIPPIGWSIHTSLVRLFFHAMLLLLLPLLFHRSPSPGVPGKPAPTPPTPPPSTRGLRTPDRCSPQARPLLSSYTLGRGTRAVDRKQQCVERALRRITAHVSHANLAAVGWVRYPEQYSGFQTVIVLYGLPIL